jgi:two-component system, NtrC family, sensor kinase
MHDIDHFSMKDMTLCGRALRQLGDETADMETVAKRMVTYLYEGLRFGPEEERAAALVRIFKTHDYAELQPAQRKAADGVVPDLTLGAGTRCLTLLASAGDREEWRSRNSSSGHQAIPLTSSALVEQFPMISNLILQFGLEPDMVVRPDPSCLQDLEETTFNVFLVEDAEGSPYIPAQDEFVRPMGIKSVLGFGGILPSGNLFATIMFMRTPVTKELGELFNPLVLSMKMALLPHDGQMVFA